MVIGQIWASHCYKRVFLWTELSQALENRIYFISWRWYSSFKVNGGGPRHLMVVHSQMSAKGLHLDV